MKKLLGIILLLNSTLSYGLFGLFSEAVCIDEIKIQERNKMFFQVNEVQPFTGSMCAYYISGQKKIEVNIEDGKKDGSSTTWYENGQKKLERYYEYGKKDGKSIQWYEDGQIDFERNYKNNKEDGKSVKWHENGQIAGEVNFKDGEKDGKWTNWHDNGQIKLKAYFKNGQEDGKLTRWYKNGKKKSEYNFKYGKGDGKFTTWYEDGYIRSEVNYKDGKKDGVNIFYRKDGPIEKEEYFSNGNSESYVSYEYYSDLTKLKSKKNYYSDSDKLNGKSIQWYENGQTKSEENYKDGKLDGEYKEWHENGKRSYEGEYKNGKQVKRFIEWYENGNKKSEGSYKGNKIENLIEFYEHGVNKDAFKNIVVVRHYDSRNDYRNLKVAYQHCYATSQKDPDNRITLATLKKGKMEYSNLYSTIRVYSSSSSTDEIKQLRSDLIKTTKKYCNFDFGVVKDEILIRFSEISDRELVNKDGIGEIITVRRHYDSKNYDLNFSPSGQQYCYATSQNTPSSKIKIAEFSGDSGRVLKSDLDLTVRGFSPLSSTDEIKRLRINLNKSVTKCNF